MFLKEIPFEPSFTQTDVETVKKWFVDNKSNFNNTANFVKLFSNGKLGARLGRPCHADIGKYPEHDQIEAVYDEVVLVGTEISSRQYSLAPNINFEEEEKKQRGFLQWFLYESFASRYIVNKEDYAFVRKYGIIVSADIPQPILQGIMIISRHFHEVNERAFSKFDELVKQGYNPNFAYIFCFNSTWSYQGQMSENHPVESVTNHRAWSLPKICAMSNFLAGRIGTSYKIDLRDKRNNYRYLQSIYNVSSIFSDNTEDRMEWIIPQLLKDEEKFRQCLSTYRRNLTNSEVYRPPNPFERLNKPPKPKPDQVTYKELFDCVFPYLKQNFEGVSNGQA
jgi:hypothetical protein